MSPNSIDNIIFRKEKTNPTLLCDDALYDLPRYKDTEYLAPLENFVPFIKACEANVRKSKYYRRYIAYIKNDIGLNACQILGNVQEMDESERLIDMHHGPLLTLFDYCAIVTNYLLYNNKRIDTFRVANIVIEEHFKNNVQIIMVSETVHDAIHTPGGPFISLDQGFGDVYTFLKKYKNGLDSDTIYKINRYYEVSKKYGTFDKDLFKINTLANKVNDNFDFL